MGMMGKTMATVALVGVLALAGCAGGNAMDAYMGEWVTSEVTIAGEGADAGTAAMMRSLLSDMTFDVDEDGTLKATVAGVECDGTWEAGSGGSCLWHYPNGNGVEQTMEVRVDGDEVHASMPMGAGQTCEITMTRKG